MESPNSASFAASDRPIDNQTALLMVQHGAMLLLVDMPQGAAFGIDMFSWRIGPLFRGVKMIPPGVHLLTYRCEDQS